MWRLKPDADLVAFTKAHLWSPGETLSQPLNFSTWIVLIGSLMPPAAL